MTPAQQQWMNTAVGRGMDPDKMYGFQCVDVVDDDAQAIFPGHSWTETVHPGNAMALLGVANRAYWDVVYNNPKDPNQLPPVGAVLVINAWPGNPFGHTGIVQEADVNGYTLIMQDGTYPKRPTVSARFAWTWHTVEGWLIPKLGSAPAPAPAQTPVAASAPTPSQPVHQSGRAKCIRQCYVRKAPNIASALVLTEVAGAVFTYRSKVAGQLVTANGVTTDLWYFTTNGHYIWAGNCRDI